MVINMIEFNSEYSFHHTTDTPTRDGFHRHMHNGYEILYFLRGDAEYIIESSVYKLAPRDLLFIRPRTFHYLNPLTDATYERFVIHFPEEMIPASCLEFAKDAKEIYRVPEDSLLARFFETWSDTEKLLSELEMREFLYPSLTAAILYLHRLPSEEAVTPIRKNAVLENMLRYIDEHPERQITVKELSETFYMSSSWITHIFRRTLGITLMQYADKKRMLFAQARIRGGEAPTETSKLCGYESYSTFYRQYKKIIGHSPRSDLSSAQ